MKTKGSINITDKRKEQIKLLCAEGFSINYIATKYKMGWETVKKISGEIDNLEGLREHKKRRMAESLWDLAIRMKNKISDAKLTKAGVPSLVIGLGTAIDKALLLTGEATGRIEVKTEKELTKELSELQAVEKELKIAWEKAEAKRKAKEKGETTDGKS